MDTSAVSADDFSYAVRLRGTDERPWCWEIWEAGMSKPIHRSDFFKTMSEASRAGKAALAEFRAIRVSSGELSILAIKGPRVRRRR
jgi:hypothetical protein